MIRRLIILLLIVGCAPRAEFYIGMTEEEFIKVNNLEINTDKGFNQTKKNNVIYQRGNSEYLDSIAPKLYPKDDPYVMYTEYKNIDRFYSYYFIFEQDSLVIISKGLWNLAAKKGIDYDKYAAPTE